MSRSPSTTSRRCASAIISTPFRCRCSSPCSRRRAGRIPASSRSSRALPIRPSTCFSADSAAILIDLRLDMEGRGGLLQILLPYAAIEPIRDLLLQSFMGEKLGRDPIWEGPLATEIWQADVAVEAVLHETQLPLKQVLSFEVGDTILFETKPNELVTLRSGDW